MKRRILNILIGLDQFCQVLLYLGNYTPDETISGIIGRKIKVNKANIIEKFVCLVLQKLQINHCVKSIDYSETIGKDI